MLLCSPQVSWLDVCALQVSCLFTLESDTDVLVRLRSARLVRRMLPADDIGRVTAQALPGTGRAAFTPSLRVTDAARHRHGQSCLC